MSSSSADTITVPICASGDISISDRSVMLVTFGSLHHVDICLQDRDAIKLKFLLRENYCEGGTRENKNIQDRLTAVFDEKLKLEASQSQRGR